MIQIQDEMIKCECCQGWYPPKLIQARDSRVICDYCEQKELEEMRRDYESQA